ncbi:MAG: serine/threonine protein kinase, partial [Chloroflexi bacterium HGW-Chloroflexi-7]
SVSARTEKAIFWAMSLHPDDRPGSVDEFRDALIGSRPVTIPSGIRIQSKPRILQNRTEIATLLGTVGVALLALVFTLLRPSF